MRHRFLAVVMAVTAAGFGPALAQAPSAAPADAAEPAAVGEWLVAKKVARIRVVDCDGRLWGVVSWEANPGTDVKNPEPRLRTRPTLGMPVLLGMTPTDPNTWQGKIYNSQDGNTYSASISLTGPDTLRVKGCFLGFLCGGEDWTRVADPDRATGQISSPQISSPKPARERRKPDQRAAPDPSATATDSAEAICLRVASPAGRAH